jgi:hypothetical protein
MIAGTQGGKTVLGPQWLWREIQRRGPGDYMAVTATNKLFNNKMIPVLLHFFEKVLGIGRFWSSQNVIELANPETGEFTGTHARDAANMWGRIVLVSAETKGGLEAATALAVWIDEAGQDTFALKHWQAVRRRVSTTGGRVLITTTLYNTGWLKSQMIDVAQRSDDAVVSTELIDNAGVEGELEMTVAMADNPIDSICLVQFDSIVNPTFDVGEFLAAKKTMHDDEFAMFYRGRVTQSKVMILSNYSELRHECSRFPIPRHWKRFLGIDPGSVNLAGIFLAQNPETKKLYAYREYFGSSMPVSDHRDEIYKGEPTRMSRGKQVPIPFSTVAIGAKSPDDQWRTDFAAVGLRGLPPKVDDYDVGVARVFKALATYQIIFFEDLFGIQDEIARYKYKVDSNGVILREVANRNRFHLIDALRYILTHLVKPSSKEASEASAAQAIEDRRIEGYTDRW